MFENNKEVRWLFLFDLELIAGKSFA